MTPNHALQRTRRGRRGCNRGVPCAGSRGSRLIVRRRCALINASAVAWAVFVTLIVGCGPQLNLPPKSIAKSDDANILMFPNSDFPPSLVQLLTFPDRYHGKKVQIMGYLHVRFEGTAIYLSREDAEYGITRNGLWVSFDKASVPFEGGIEPKQLDKKYVLLEGTFDKDDFGHLGAWKGALANVTRAYELRRDP